MIKRIFFNIILLVSVFIFPWWIIAILAFVGIFIFKNFYEYIIIAIIIYSLYALPGNRIISSPIFFSSSIIILYIIIQIIKNNIILYQK